MESMFDLMAKLQKEYGEEQGGNSLVNLTKEFEAKPDGLSPVSWLFNTPEGILSLAAARSLYADDVPIALVMDDDVWSAPEIASNYAQHLRFCEADFVAN